MLQLFRRHLASLPLVHGAGHAACEPPRGYRRSNRGSRRRRRLDGVGLRYEPLHPHAGVEYENRTGRRWRRCLRHTLGHRTMWSAHRSRSSASISPLSLCGRPSSRRRMASAAARASGHIDLLRGQHQDLSEFGLQRAVVAGRTGLEPLVYLIVQIRTSAVAMFASRQELLDNTMLTSHLPKGKNRPFLPFSQTPSGSRRPAAADRPVALASRAGVRSGARARRRGSGPPRGRASRRDRSGGRRAGSCGPSDRR